MSNLLSILSWNVRGLNSPVRHEVVPDMILTARPLVVCLQETKLSSSSQQLLVETIGPKLDKYSFLPAEEANKGWHSHGLAI
jgi:exonuclease III